MSQIKYAVLSNSSEIAQIRNGFNVQQFLLFLFFHSYFLLTKRIKILANNNVCSRKPFLSRENFTITDHKQYNNRQ